MANLPVNSVCTSNALYTAPDGSLWRMITNDNYERLAKYSDIIMGTVTTNSSDTPLTLSGRGYYNYIGAVDGEWNLPPADISQGMFYRIYNKASNGISILNIIANGTDQLFRGGTLLDNIELNYSENLTIVSDGTDWNCYN